MKQNVQHRFIGLQEARHSDRPCFAKETLKRTQCARRLHYALCIESRVLLIEILNHEMLGMLRKAMRIDSMIAPPVRFASVAGIAHHVTSCDGTSMLSRFCHRADVDPV